jgi:hypothetical protein
LVCRIPCRHLYEFIKLKNYETLLRQSTLIISSYHPPVNS